MAPTEVLVGMGPKIQSSASMVVEQDAPIPVFLKEKPGSWMYMGEFRGDRLERNTRMLSAAAKKAGRPLWAILYMHAA